MKKTATTLLIIDDNEDILFTAKVLLKKHFENVLTLTQPKKVLSALTESNVDVVLLDMNYRIGFEDGKEGIYLLKEIKKISPKTVVILMTAFGKVETAVEGLKIGAFDYILKPWDNEKLIQTVKSAVAQNRKQTYTTPESFSYFKGSSIQVVKAYTLAEKVAKTDANVLILGENGTGKYVMARYIHEHSSRSSQPFVHVDLGSLNENIFESELFGYVKGAFTDAKTDTKGRFEMAQNGTIFLDEIGNVPMSLQAKLLQVLQNKSVVRLGESKPQPLNVRIITATNLDLTEQVQTKNFREDLYYRINTMEITLPPLRDCASDKLPLAEFLLQKMKIKYNKESLAFNEAVKQNIQHHAWKGNIREMENRIERAVILSDDSLITLSDMDLESITPIQASSDELNLSDIERVSVEKALQKHQNNISKAAEELGLSRAALYRRIEKYGILL